MTVGNDLEDRFGHLLQPIRDLAKSWDVDIASCLTDYLEELERVTITFDEGKTTMNFAEAALLIQGSACVYSKKVENLYSLVFQVMDVISNKKNKQKNSASGKNDNNDGGDDDDEDEEFLSLDNIPIGKNITMREGDKSVLPVKLTPLAIIPLGNTERGQNPLLSKTGEILGSRDDFKMNTCYIHKSGAMLLDMSYMALLQMSLQFPHLHHTAEPMVPIAEVPETDTTSSATLTEQMEELSPPPAADVSMNEDAPPLFENDEEIDDDIPQVPQPEIRERLRARKPIIEKVVTRKPLSDIFIELDPYSLSDKPDKNIGKGKVLKTPAELKDDDDTSRKRKRKPVPEKPKVPLSVFIQKSCFSHHEKYTKTVFNTPTFEALENQFWKEFVRRKQIWTKEKKLIKSVNSKQLEEFEDREIDIPDADEFGGGEDDVDDEVVDNGLEAAPAFDISVGHEHDRIHNFTFNRDELTSYEELARQHIEKFMACGNYFHTTEIAQKVAEWEEKIIPRLEAEEHRPAFDIHQYGSQILDKLTVKTRVKFAHISAGKPDHEICRLFSSLLQLVNAGNIQIHKPDNFLKAMDEFELELLSMVRHHEELANKQYDAPTQSNSGEAISV